MSDSDATPKRGRRARRLSPEEAAALENRTAAEVSGELPPVPPARGAVASPGADAPVPTLRKFGRRARIIELTDPVEETGAPGEQVAASPASGGDETPSTSAEDDQASPTSPGASSADTAADEGSGDDGQAGTVPGAADWTEAGDGEGKDGATSESSDTGSPDGSGAAPIVSPTMPTGPLAPSPAANVASAVIERDSDGVELGEMSVTEAPDPKPAPRFDGQVLHRAESSNGRPLLWAVWIVIAIALIVLVTLLLTGVLGAGAANALDAPLSDLTDVHTALEEPAA